MSTINNSRKPLVLLVDGDLYAYNASSAVEREVDWGDGLWTLHSDLNQAIYSFESTVRQITEFAESKLKKEVADIKFALTGPNNFRKTVLDTYKANRAGKRKPVVYWPLVDYIKENYSYGLEDVLEGDDLLGIWSTQKDHDEHRVIVSVDKDFKTIPGTFLNPGKGTCKTYSEQEANYWHLYQTLVGDTTDNYGGCKGIGDVKAKAALEKDCSWETVVRLFESKEFTEDDALVQARCAFILHDGYYDFDSGKVNLWLPK